jgi:protein SCO1/2
LERVSVMRRYILFGIGGILGVVFLLVGWQFTSRPYTYQGSLIEPPIKAPEIALIDQDGQPFRLSDHLGKVVLVFYGYTNCPDVCPLTLSDFKLIKADLGEKANQVTFVFVTVDPERDTQDRLKAYLSNFDTTFTGLTGSRPALESVWKTYGVYQAKQETGSAAGYLVDHTARTYAIDKKGNLRLTYPFEMERQAMLDDVRQLIKEQ